MAAIEKTNVGLGTALAAAFDFNAAKPLDSRLTVPAYDGLAALSDAGAAYPGMRVYVETGDKQGNYQYINSEWASETAEIKALIDSVATAAMEFKGAISNGILPTEGDKGDMYKITTTNVIISAELNAEEEKEVVAKPGDTIVRNGDGKWFYVPSGDDMDDTWRPIKAGGNTLSDTETLELIAGGHVTITEEAGKVTIAAEDTHYESKIVVGDGSADIADATAEDGYVHLNLVEEGVVKSSHKIVGSGGISVTHTAAEGEDGVNVITIEAAEGAKYDLTAKTENDEAILSLVGTDNTEDKVAIVGYDAATVTVEDGKIKISTHDTTYSGGDTGDIIVNVENDVIHAEFTQTVIDHFNTLDQFMESMQEDMAAKSGYVGADQFNSTVEGFQGEDTAIKGRLDVVETALGADGAVKKAIAAAKDEAIATADKDATEKVVVALAEAQKYADASVDALEDKLANGEDDFTVKYAGHAVNADSAESALQDSSGNIITDTYETKDDANAKLAEAKKYTDELVKAIPAQIDYTVSVSVREDEEGDDHTAFKHYILEQCGNEIGHIDIPRDLVVEEGHVKEVAEADKPYAGAVVGEKYIELKIENQEEPIYIPAKDLVEYISVEDTDTIDLTLTAEHVLTADVKANSIGTGHLTTEVNTSLGLANSALQSVTIAGHELTKAGKTTVSADEIATALDLANKYQEKGDYASAAQGTKADTALQEITTTANNGLKVTNKNKIDIDTDVVFVLDCNW